MDQERRARLAAAGIDVDGVLARLMGNEALLERFLKQFPQDANFAALRAALNIGDWKGAVTAAHSLKGLCGNLSMTELFGLLARQVELLRQGDGDGAAALMEDIAPAYERVRQAIRACYG